MDKFIVNTLHDTKAVMSMSLANSCLYHPEEPAKIVGLGALLIVSGFLIQVFIPSVVATVLILIGCLIITNAEYPAKNDARKVLQQMGDSFPTIQLCFSNSYISIHTPLQTGTIEYDLIKRIAEDKSYYFLFLGDHSAYVVDKAGFSHGDVSKFPNFIQEKTGVSIEQSYGFWRKILSFNPLRRK